MEFLIDGMTTINVMFLILGFILMGVELSMPGLSFPGIAGTICFIVSIFLIADTVAEAVVLIAGILVILAIMFAIIIKILSKRGFNLVL
ncbi:MAG: hypothetical protein ATN34_02510 [Epulopiscium sp. Nele67-Bin002]|nr:MAG: hypothetical protein ATN34_02510 [Epulopiscium sp. Nele67-Bin002]